MIESMGLLLALCRTYNTAAPECASRRPPTRQPVYIGLRRQYTLPNTAGTAQTSLIKYGTSRRAQNSHDGTASPIEYSSQPQINAQPSPPPPIP
ncbi:hypothetical protein HOY80DRAFT_996440 [Tuber brumale]|nr:hypothetical protein HOY80DRAFT_996440 [Tuber brumale]